jgi:curved DNA-binding protein CbpA
MGLQMNLKQKLRFHNIRVLGNYIYKKDLGKVLDILLAKLTVNEAEDILELGDSWDSSTLKDAYRKAALKHHPDKGGDAEMMKKVNEAYELLKDKPGSGSTTKTDWDAINAKYKKAAYIVLNDLKATFKPDNFSEYFEKHTGKKYIASFKYFPEKEEIEKMRSPNNVHVTGEWKSEDGNTIFSMSAGVDLHNVVWPKSELGSSDLDIGYDMWVNLSILHDNRKVKFKRQNWDRSQLKSILYDPSKLFPEAKIKAMFAGKDKARKFSKRDMELGLTKKLNASLKKDHAFVPMGTNFTLVMFRYVFGGGWNERRTSINRIAVWGFQSVYDKKNTKNRINFTASSGVLDVIESEAILDVLAEAQKKLKDVSDIKEVADAIVAAIKPLKVTSTSSK